MVINVMQQRVEAKYLAALEMLEEAYTGDDDASAIPEPRSPGADSVTLGIMQVHLFLLLLLLLSSPATSNSPLLYLALVNAGVGAGERVGAATAGVGERGRPVHQEAVRHQRSLTERPRQFGLLWHPSSVDCHCLFELVSSQRAIRGAKTEVVSHDVKTNKIHKKKWLI